MISRAMEDYLKVLSQLHQENQSASTNDVALAMGVSPASATNMLKKLADTNLVIYTPYRGASLTKSGEKAALEIIRHHRLLELYLNEALLCSKTSKELFFEIGIAYGGQKKYLQAMHAFQNALNYSLDDPVLHYQLGVVYQALSIYDLAINACNS